MFEFSFTKKQNSSGTSAKKVQSKNIIPLLNKKSDAQILSKIIQTKDSLNGKNTKQLSGFINTSNLQLKLTIGKPNDSYEQEADQIADKVVGSSPSNSQEGIKRKVEEKKEPILPKLQLKEEEKKEEPIHAKLQLKEEEKKEEPIHTKLQMKGEEKKEEPIHAKLQLKEKEKKEEPIRPKLQLKEDEKKEEPIHTKLQMKEEEKKEKLIQTKSFGETHDQDISAQLNNKKSGSPLLSDTKTYMESRFGVDFDGVRIHTDSNAVQMNKSLNAQAFTHGNDVYFNEGKYNPGTSDGNKLIAHELTHVVQQNFNKVQKREDSTEQCITEEYAKSLSDEELGNEIELNQRRRFEENVSDEECVALEENFNILTAEQTRRNSRNAGGKIDSKKIIRIAWTFDDGPTPLSKDMIATLGSNLTGVTWFIMYDKLLQSPGLADNLAKLKTIQDNGGEIGIHSFNSDSKMSHASWFPSSNPDHHSYTNIDAAMTALREFYKILTDACLKIKFVRLPGGLISELMKYLDDLGVSNPNNVAKEIINGKKIEGKAAQVVADFEKMKTTLSSLGLHLWGGSSKASEISNLSWEAETSGVESRADTTTLHVSPQRARSSKASKDNPGIFERTVDIVTEEKPRSLVILAHDTTSNDIKEVGIDNTKMNEYALSKGVRIEYCTMSQLYEKVRGTAP